VEELHDGRLAHKSAVGPTIASSQLMRQLSSLLQQLIPTSLSSHFLDLTQLLRVFPWVAQGESKSGLVAGTHSFFLSAWLQAHSPVYLLSPLQSVSLKQVLTAAGVVQVPWKQTLPKTHSLSMRQEAPLALELNATQVPESQTEPKAHASPTAERGTDEQSPPTAI